MLESVFDLFTQDATTIARSAGGLGIGLTIVKRLVELHGGTIEVESEGLGCGSQFTVRFPVCAMEVVSRSSAEGAKAAPVRKRVLVVEDNPDVRESLGLLLAMWGHGVEFANSGVDGLRLACDGRPDVALIDIGLPGLNGYEVARRIRLSDLPWARDVKLVALTGYGRDTDRQEALQAGFDSHLVKPIDPEVLAQALQL